MTERERRAKNERERRARLKVDPFARTYKLVLNSEDVEAHVGGRIPKMARFDGQAAGCVRFQLEDPQFWPDVPGGDSVFIHRLAVRRAFSGGVVSKALMDWAAARGRHLRRTYLRLDCEADAAKLRALYERHGFRLHSERDVGPYRVARYERAL